MGMKLGLASSSSFSRRAIIPSLPLPPRKLHKRTTPMGKKLRLVSSSFSRMARTTGGSPSSYSCPETLSFRKEAVSFSSSGADDVEAVIRGVLKSDARLLFDPAGGTRLMASTTGAPTATPTATVPFDGGVAVAVDSADPYSDFRASMAEMVTARGGGVKDWEWMGEMLVWYLKMNEKRTHEVIVGAFRDLILGLACDINNTTTPPPPPPRSVDF